MAAAFVSKPGTEYGPCPKCQHKDCAELRALVESGCHWCDDPIGYETRYYRVDENVVEGGVVVGTKDGYVHAACEEDAAAAEGK